MRLADSVSRLFLGVLLVAASVSADTPQSKAAQGLEQALGRWYSTEQFEGEPRFTFAFQQGDSLEGWAVLLGQKRKDDHRATLGLSFMGASWDDRRMRFSTILPEDEGSIDWELRVVSPAAAVLVAVTVDGEPGDADLKWEMTRGK
jgi:hypothetical protein